MTKRKAPTAFTEEEDNVGAPRRLDDWFVADEILPRLPAHEAHAFSAASKFFRRILTDLNYWLSPRRLSRPSPRAACLVVRASDGGGARARLLHEFHYADAAFSAEPAVVRAAAGSLAAYSYAGACNGLVLLAAMWSNRSFATGIIFNPASGEEETVTVALDALGGGGRFHSFCGLG